MIIVCAGNYKEYLSYLRDENLGPDVAVYAEPYKIMTRHFTEIVIVGTFMWRSDADELLKLAHSRVINR